MLQMAVETKVEAALRGHGAIAANETLIWERYGVGFRLIVIGPQGKGKTLQQYSLIYPAMPTGSVRDQVNGVVGRFIMERKKCHTRD